MSATENTAQLTWTEGLGMLQRLSFSALAEYLDSDLTTHVVAHSHLNSGGSDPLF